MFEHISAYFLRTFSVDSVSRPPFHAIFELISRVRSRLPAQSVLLRPTAAESSTGRPLSSSDSVVAPATQGRPLDDRNPDGALGTVSMMQGHCEKVDNSSLFVGQKEKKFASWIYRPGATSTFDWFKRTELYQKGLCFLYFNRPFRLYINYGIFQGRSESNYINDYDLAGYIIKA